jgi:hypothetical protein
MQSAAKTRYRLRMPVRLFPCEVKELCKRMIG